MKKEEQFLKEYKELCLEHGFEIIGCGDCGSAWLSELNDENLKHKKLSWEKGYTVIKFADKYNMEDRSRIKDNF